MVPNIIRYTRAVAPAAVLLSTLAIFGCTAEMAGLLDGGLDGGRACIGNAQCKAGEVCKSNVCVPAGTCSKKSDCSGDEECIGGRCQIPGDDGGAGDGGGSDAGNCTSSAQCEPGYRCNPQNSGCEPAGIIAVDPPETLDFGAVPYGQEVTLPVTISNKGKGVLSLTGFEVQNPAGNVCFRIVSGGQSANLAENEYKVLEVGYKQNGAGIDEGALRIASNDSEKGIYALGLKSSYKGLPKFSIYVKEEGTGNWVKDYPEQGDGYEYFVDFGYVSQGSKKTLVYGIKNITDGDAILELDDLTALNTPKNKVTLTFRTGEEATSAALPTPVQATPATHIFVAVGSLVYAHFEYEATDKVDSDEQDLKLTTNDDDINGSGNRGNSAVTFKVTARSKEAKIQVSPSSLDFGEVQINQGGKKLVVTIGNPGDSDLTLKPTSGLKNPAGTYYSLNPASLDRIVPAKGTLPVEVTFAPTAIQGENNWLVLDSDDKSTPHIEVPLKGKGTDPTLLITSTPVATGNPPTVNYGSVIKGTTTAATFSVKNVGFGSLLLDNVVLTQAAGNYFQIAELAKNGSPASFPITLAEQGADTVTFKVNLTPQVIGTVTGSLKFANSDAKNKDYIINLTSFVQNNKGEPCQYDADCSTGFCTDGVCCEERCTAACERCDKSPNKGNCVAADLGVPDPNQKCAVQDKTTCGTNGLCGGARAECQKWNNQTVCQNASCSTAVLNLPHYCNGTGTCTEGGTQNCTPYACAGTACKSSCTATADCAPNYSCNVGLHVCLKNDGQQCGSSSECYNNNCCSGYCRNLTNDANNCGSCGRVCQQNHASNPCVSSVCTPSCNSGFNNCDSNPINGCEYDMSTYLNSSGSAEYLGAKPGEEKCATALFCLVQASRETFATTSGHQSKWYYAKVQDNSGCNTDNSHKVTLSVPYGVTYDLNVYYPAASTLQHSISVSNGSGTVYPRMKNTEFYYWLEVKFRSGSYCGSWTLVDEWNRCLE